MERLVFLGVLAALITVAYSQRTCNASTSCEACVEATEIRNGSNSIEQRFRCFWCGPENACRSFSVSTVIPLHGISCPGYRYNIATCRINALTIIIIVAVVLVLFVVLVCCVCCCCCIWCARRRKRKQIIEENRYLDEKEGIRQRSADRRAERKAKHDEIRRKYGLYNEDQSAGTYKKLDS